MKNWFHQHQKFLTGMGFLALLLVSLVVRLVNFQSLYPYFWYQDELRHSELSLELIRKQTLRTDFYYYPHLTLYLTAFGYAGYFLVKNFPEVIESRSFQPVKEEVKKLEEESWNSLKIERGLSLILGLLAVSVFFLLARNLLGDGFGLASAFLFSLFPLSVSLSQLAKVDIYMMFFQILSWLFQIKIIREGKIRDYIFAGVFAGLCFDCKINFSAGISLLCAMLVRAKEENLNQLGQFLDRRILAGILATGLSAFLGSPFYFLNLDEAIKNVGWVYFSTEWIPYFHFDPHQFWTDRYYYSLMVLIPSMVSVPVWLIAIAGISQKIIRVDFREWFFFLFCFFSFAYTFNSSAGSHVYYLQFYLLPIIALFSVSLLRQIFLDSTLRGKIVVGIILFLLLGLSLLRFQFYHQLTFLGYEPAGAYLSKALEPGSKVLSFGIYLHGPALEHLSVKRAWPQDLSRTMIEKEDPDYILVNRWDFAGFEKFYRDKLPIARYLKELLNGDWGYVPVKTWVKRYPGDFFYQWLDPEFRVELCLLKREYK